MPLLLIFIVEAVPDFFFSSVHFNPRRLPPATPRVQYRQPFASRAPQRTMPKSKKALITGITGQDGAYLAEFLLEKGYEVHGVRRRTSLFNTARIDHLYRDPHEKGVKFKLHYGDLTDSTNLIRIIQEVQPHEIYNLG